MPKQIDALLSKIEKILVAEIPKAVKAAKVKEQVYCLRIWYNGTDMDETAVPSLMLVKESARKTFLKKRPKEALYYVWGADEQQDEEYSITIELSNDKLLDHYGVWYEHLCELEDDEELQPFREMTQRVALQLNALDWTTILPVTDDFIVFPADGSHTFCDDLGDMAASVPKPRLKLLQSRKLLESAK